MRCTCFGPRDWPIAALEFPHHLRHWSQTETLKGLPGVRTLEEQSGQQGGGTAPFGTGIQAEGLRHLLAPFRGGGGCPNGQQPGQGGDRLHSFWAQKGLDSLWLQGRGVARQRHLSGSQEPFMFSRCSFVLCECFSFGSLPSLIKSIKAFECS